MGGDKSISHRLALLGALAEGTTRLTGFSPSADCQSTLDCLTALGTGVERAGDRVIVRGRPFAAPVRVLHAGNSGSTMRMLLGALASHPLTATLDGDASLRSRPMERVAAPLRLMGARVTTTSGRPPLTIEGGDLTGLSLDLEVPSAQVKTAILLAGLGAAGTTQVVEPSGSRDHTERWLPAFGASLEREGFCTRIAGGQRLRGIEAAVPGDPSSAAFLLVAALLLPRSEVRCEGLCLNPRRIGFATVLQAMGASLEVDVQADDPEPTGRLVSRSSALHGVTIEADAIPGLVDEVPILAVSAALAEGATVFHGVGELRVKESDRIAAIVEGLTALGGDAVAGADTLTVRGGRKLRGAALRSHGDHRIAMALAVAALAADGPSRMDDADCVGVSFPDFWRLLSEGVG